MSEGEAGCGEAPQRALRPLVLLGIDPDATGALAVVQWWDEAAAEDAARLQHTAIELFDMPMMRVQIGARLRKCARTP